MTKPAAFRATYSDLKLIKTRQCVQIVFELPLADFDAAYDVLGGLPDSSKEKWFGIAAIIPKNVFTDAKNDIVASSRDWRDLQPAQQAGIRCADAIFIAYLGEVYPKIWHETGEAAECVRQICGVNSRAELGTKHAARVIWHQLDTEYQAWLVKERVGA